MGVYSIEGNRGFRGDEVYRGLVRVEMVLTSTIFVEI